MPGMIVKRYYSQKWHKTAARARRLKKKAQRRERQEGYERVKVCQLQHPLPPLHPRCQLWLVSIGGPRVSPALRALPRHRLLISCRAVQRSCPRLMLMRVADLASPCRRQLDGGFRVSFDFAIRSFTKKPKMPWLRLRPFFFHSGGIGLNNTCILNQCTYTLMWID